MVLPFFDLSTVQHHASSYFRHASDSGTLWQDGWTILGAKSELVYSETALSWKLFRIGHIHFFT
jgi:hypothetical protein